MEQFDFFEFLGIGPEKSVKKEKKAAVKNEPTKKNTSDVKKDAKNKEHVNFPVKVITGYMNTITYQENDFKTANVTAKDVFQKFTSENISFPSSLCGYYMNGESTIVVFLKKCYASSKGEIKANLHTKYVLGGVDLDLSTQMTNAECSIETKTLIENFSSSHAKYGAIHICYSATQNTVIPYFAEAELKDSVSLPVNVTFWGHEDFSITTKDIVNKAADNAEECLEENIENIPVNKNSSIDIKATHEQLLSIVEEHFSEFRGLIKLCYNKKEHTIIVVMKEDISSKSVPVTKEVVYPTDAQVSLFVHIRFKLQPEWFDNKTEITEKEFKQFLEERYPEFSPERTFIVYDAKRNLIMPCLKSSSKGALLTAHTDIEEAELMHSPFPFIREYEEGSSYRVETTPVADFRICMVGDGSRNTFHYKLPKIPVTMLVVAKKFFHEVYRKKGTESFLQLFYDDQEESYFWYLPKQVATSGAVTAIRSSLNEREFLLVADFHSHGHFRAFWSDTDCRDEKGSRIYGVMGNFNEKIPTECYRVGCGGFFAELDMKNIIDYDALEQEDVADMLRFLCERMDRIVVKASSFNYL